MDEINFIVTDTGCPDGCCTYVVLREVNGKRGTVSSFKNAMDALLAAERYARDRGLDESHVRCEYSPAD